MPRLRDDRQIKSSSRYGSAPDVHAQKSLGLQTLKGIVPFVAETRDDSNFWELVAQVCAAADAIFFVLGTRRMWR